MTDGGYTTSQSALVLLDGFTYPPLPPITDKAIEQAVFTHRSVVNTAAAHLVDGLELESYDKLAHVGDSLLNTFITLLLHAKNPKSRPKVATDLRSKLVNRQINSRISRHYGLPQRVKTGRATQGTFLASDDEAGEVREAYLAGLFFSSTGSGSGTTSSRAPPQASAAAHTSSHAPAHQHGSSDGGDQGLNLLSHGQAFEKLGQFLIPLYTPLINTLCQKWGLLTPVYDDGEKIWPD